MTGGGTIALKAGSKNQNKIENLIDGSICPYNIYSAKTRIENSTMKITGPMGCHIPFYPDPLDALTSYRREQGKWIISTGGSWHWGASMNFLRLFIDTTDIPYPTPLEIYGYPSEKKREHGSPDVVELSVKRDGTTSIRTWGKIEDYRCKEVQDEDVNIQARVTVLHSPWMTDIADRLERLVKDCGHRPKPDIIVDVWGKWYLYCTVEVQNLALTEICRQHNVNKTNSNERY